MILKGTCGTLVVMYYESMQWSFGLLMHFALMSHFSGLEVIRKMLERNLQLEEEHSDLILSTLTTDQCRDESFFHMSLHVALPRMRRFLVVAGHHYGGTDRDGENEGEIKTEGGQNDKISSGIEQ